MADNHPSHLVMRPTLVKVRVGCAKLSCYDLPSKDHTYGKASAPDEESAGQVISNWVASDPSLKKESESKIVYTNVLAIKNGCISAKTIRQYGKDHPSIRLKESLETNSSRVDSNHEGPFGAKTIYSEDSMANIMACRFMNENVDDYDYPSMGHIKQTGKMPKPRSTVASKAVEQSRMAAEAKKEKANFCMKKFQNIPGKLKQILEENARKSSRSPGRK